MNYPAPRGGVVNLTANKLIRKINMAHRFRGYDGESWRSKKIRKTWFSEEYLIDSNLLNMLDTDDREFDFLKNPAAQNIYN